MTLEQFWIFFPSIILHLILTCGIAYGAWAFAHKYKLGLTFGWQLPVLGAGVVSIFLSFNSLIGVHQARIYNDWQQRKLTEQAKASAPTPPQVDPALKMKSEFLLAADGLLGQPDKINSQSKKELFSKFALLFPKGAEDRKLYFDNLMRAHECQRYFLEDAMDSFKAQKATKSKEREKCEQQTGAFFNREKLLPPETLQNNTRWIELMALHQGPPNPSGSPVPADIQVIRSALDGVIRKMDSLKRLFE